MQIALQFLYAFLVGGFICAIGQLLLDFTKLTSARILVIFLLSGVVLQAFGLYEYLVDFAGAGATVPSRASAISSPRARWRAPVKASSKP